MLADQLGDLRQGFLVGGLVRILDVGRTVVGAVPVTQRLEEPAGVGGQQVPLRRTGTRRVRADDLDSGFKQVVPALQSLRVSFAGNEGDDRTEGDGHPRLVTGDVILPVLAHLTAVDEPVDVRLDREVHQVGGHVPGNLAGLVAGGAVGFGEAGVRALVGLTETVNELLEAGLRHGVGHQVEPVIAGGRVRGVRVVDGAAGCHEHAGGGDEADAGEYRPQAGSECHVHFLSCAVRNLQTALSTVEK